MSGTYDDRQADAVLVVCAGCHRAFWMVVAHRLCVRCRLAEVLPTAPA